MRPGESWTTKELMIIKNNLNKPTRKIVAILRKAGCERSYKIISFKINKIRRDSGEIMIRRNCFDNNPYHGLSEDKIDFLKSFEKFDKVINQYGAL